MSEWIRKEIKPKHDMLAICWHSNGWMGRKECMYYKDMDVWRYYSTLEGGYFSLDITHYLPIPDMPESDE